MKLPLSRALVADLDWRESCASTNTELVATAGERVDLAVIATDTQTAGRGRLGRSWIASAGTALAVSVLVRHVPLNAGAAAAANDAEGEAGHPFSIDVRRLGWLPLLAGVAMCRAVHHLGVNAAGLKWPNDVLVSGRKISGILTELTPIGVVIGAGLNLSASRDELAVPTATSLVLEGVTREGVDSGARGTHANLTDRALAAYLAELLPLVAQWRAAPDVATLRATVAPHLQTIGRAVRVDRPGQPLLLGTATGLDDDGRLLVHPSTPGSTVVAVAAGDVTHLRYE